MTSKWPANGVAPTEILSHTVLFALRSQADSGDHPVIYSYVLTSGSIILSRRRNAPAKAQKRDEVHSLAFIINL